MNIFLGDEVTITKGDTIVTGQVTGLVLDSNKELERLYIAGIDNAFWFSYDKWMIIDDTEEESDEI